MNKSATAAEFATRCKAFTGEGVRKNLVLVDEDGSVLVWDEVGGHHTRCHALSARQQARLRRLAHQQ